jgi:ribonuclease HI
MTVTINAAMSQRAAVDSLTVATDGACSGNPGPAGWAWVDEHGTWRNGSLARATNQVGELLGLLNAVRDHQHVRHLTVEIDSIYALNTYSSWMDAHAARGWTTQAKKPTSNREIIEEMLAARDARRAAGLPPVRLVKVKGHSKGRYPLNDAADDRATAASAQARARNIGTWSGEGLTVGARQAR